MEFSEYRILRERLGSQDKASKVLDVTTATIWRRETGKQRITREAEFALRWAAQSEAKSPTPERRSVRPIQRRKR